jgi:hemerythrin-like domain-containing protein
MPVVNPFLGGIIMDAIALLKDDHKKVKALLEELSATTNRATKKRAELLARIKTEVQLHARIEEEIFYPAFKDADGKTHATMFFEAKEEHRAVEKLVLPDLEQTSVDSDQFAGRAKVLKELIEHHAEEEESEMFKQARATLSKQQLAELGARMEARKAELRESS